jgi:uncharacterized protein (TIGR02246 family)
VRPFSFLWAFVENPTRNNQQKNPNFCLAMQALRPSYSPQPEDIPRAFVEAWNQRDAVALANLFAEDAEFVNVVGLWWHDRKAIYKAHHYGLTRIFADSDLAIRQLRSKMLGDDVAVVHARMVLQGQTSHGGVQAPQRRQNVFTFVTQRKSEGWICVAAHNTDIVPGKETNIIDEKGRLSAIDYRKES